MVLFEDLKTAEQWREQLFRKKLELLEKKTQKRMTRGLFSFRENRPFSLEPSNLHSRICNILADSAGSVRKY